MKIQIHTSVSAAKKDPTKYNWYVLKQGSAHFGTAHKDYDLTITKSDPFGIKFFKGSYFLIDKGDLSIQFKLSVEEGKKLLSRCVGWKGTVEGKKVSAGEIELSSTKKQKAPTAKKEPVNKTSNKPAAFDPKSIEVFADAVVDRISKSTFRKKRFYLWLNQENDNKLSVSVGHPSHIGHIGTSPKTNWTKEEAEKALKLISDKLPDKQIFLRYPEGRQFNMKKFKQSVGILPVDKS